MSCLCCIVGYSQTGGLALTSDGDGLIEVDRSAGESWRPAALEARGITKRFPGVLANDGIDFLVKHGEVHALLGENGSGKTTLCNILTGFYKQDEGQVAVDGQVVTYHSPADAHRHGVFMVHQHFTLVESLSVAENVMLGRTDQGRLYNRRRAEEEVTAAAERFDIAVNPKAQVSQLSVGERQRVEILKALCRDARTLILDEPTAVLTPQESEQLFVSIRRLAADGGSVVFISHRLNEVLAVCDRVTVLRNGKKTGAVDVRSSREGTPVDSRRLARMMVGREVELTRRPHRANNHVEQLVGAQPRLEVDGVSAFGDRGELALQGISLQVRPGEILGVAGVAGNGQRELADVVCGLRPRVSGDVLLDGVSLPSDPLGVIERGVAYVPEDRLASALAPGMTTAENLALKAVSHKREFCRGLFVQWPTVQRWAEALLRDFAVKGTVHLRVEQLSGGNAQKVVLARELSSDPLLLVTAGPTRGLDIGATDTIRRLILDTAEAGVGVLMFSEDLDEVMDLSDRIAVLFRGQVAGVLEADGADAHEIGLLMMGESAA
jgi:simple sugar transport system ATP-binding protein